MSGSAGAPLATRRLDDTRLTLPRSAHRVLGAHAALAADAAGCILALTPAVWDDTLPLLQQLSAHDASAAALFRLLAASETVAAIDGRGRLSLPRLHMEWAGLIAAGPVVVVVLGAGVQVWEPERLAAHLATASRRLRDLKSDRLRQQLAFFEQLAPREREP